ncbi:hypothetical protein OCU04_000648 [Sclerotinia nivalis]|uniref:Uncharacterized protein n=1 Tax=Sclerotinia nivalis TaxID=352851 RepID=A0A9X0AWL6_9HELO|nr:hypothetical protein OCU04_000648 [Sclerotinia nivalis]
MSSGSNRHINVLDKDERKGKISNSGSVRSNNGKKTELGAPPKEENRAKSKDNPPSRKRSDSQVSGKDSVRSQWSSDCELPDGVTSATDLACHRKLASRQSSSNSSPPRRSPPKLQREKSLDSFSSLSETPSEKIESDITHIRMKKGWLDLRIRADREKDTVYDRQIVELKRELRQLRRRS